MLIKTHSLKLEKIILRTLILTTVMFLISTTFLFFEYRLIGLHSNLIIGLTFIISCFLFFSIVKNSTKKIITVFVLTPLILISIYTFLIGETLYEKKINNAYTIKTSIGGFLTCGENIKITKSKFLIFEKAVFKDNSLCLKGIYKIDLIEITDNHVELLIYHDGEMDSENPYIYEIVNKNVW